MDSNETQRSLSGSKGRVSVALRFSDGLRLSYTRHCKVACIEICCGFLTTFPLPSWCQQFVTISILYRIVFRCCVLIVDSMRFVSLGMYQDT